MQQEGVNMRSTESSRMYRDLEKRLERQGWIDRFERAREHSWELRKFWVEHEGAPNKEVDAFRSLIREATKEEDIQQIREWRIWLMNNIDVPKRSIDDG